MMLAASSMLRSIRQIVVMPFSEQRNQQALWAMWAALMAGVLISALALKIYDVRAAFVFASFFALVSFMIWWLIFIGGVQRQCTPINSRLLPGLPWKILVVVASLWLSGSVLLALIVASQIGNFVDWWLAISLWMCLCTWSFNFSAMAILIVLAFTNSVTGQISLDYFEVGTITCTAAVVATLCFAALTFAKTTLPRTPRSDHAQGRRSRYRASQRSLARTIIPLSGSLALYLWLLKRALRRPASPRQLTSFMLGPRGHWSNTIYFLSLAPTGCVFAFAYGVSSRAATLFLTFLMVSYPNTALKPRDWLLTRREQSLLVLAPKFPQGRKLSESMGDIIVSSHNSKFIQFLIFVVAGFLVRASLKTVDPFEIIAGIESLLAFNLITLGLQFRSLAHLKNRPDFDFVASLKTLILVALVLAPVVLTGLFFGIAAICIVLLAYVFGGITFLIWRRRRMLDGPPSLPAGRLADD